MRCQLFNKQNQTIHCTLCGLGVHDAFREVEAKVSQDYVNCENFEEDLKHFLCVGAFNECLYARLEGLSLTVSLGEILNIVRNLKHKNLELTLLLYLCLVVHSSHQLFEKFDLPKFE